MALQHPPAILVLDNDECIGQWAGLSVAFGLCQRYAPDALVPEKFAAAIAHLPIIRPGLRDLLLTAAALKREGRVLALVMCTAASNQTGWVHFLLHVIEAWLGQPVYDAVFSAEDMTQWNMANNWGWGGPVMLLKDMNMIRAHFGVSRRTPVIMLDDRPQFIINADLALGVAPFTVPFDGQRLLLSLVPRAIELFPEVYVDRDAPFWRQYRDSKVSAELFPPVPPTTVHVQSLRQMAVVAAMACKFGVHFVLQGGSDAVPHVK